MTANELGHILKEMYEGAKSDKTTMIHLFGVKYAAEIRDSSITPKELLKIAKMPESYQTEISKGMRLSRYVDVKEKYR